MQLYNGSNEHGDRVHDTHLIHGSLEKNSEGLEITFRRTQHHRKRGAIEQGKTQAVSDLPIDSGVLISLMHSVPLTDPS